MVSPSTADWEKTVQLGSLHRTQTAGDVHSAALRFAQGVSQF